MPSTRILLYGIVMMAMLLIDMPVAPAHTPAPNPECELAQNPHDYWLASGVTFTVNDMRSSAGGSASFDGNVACWEAPASCPEDDEEEPIFTDEVCTAFPVVPLWSHDGEHEFGRGGGLLFAGHHTPPFAVSSITHPGSWSVGANYHGSNVISTLEGDCLEGPFPTFAEADTAPPSALDYYGSCAPGGPTDFGPHTADQWVIFVDCSADLDAEPADVGCGAGGHIWSSDDPIGEPKFPCEEDPDLDVCSWPPREVCRVGRRCHHARYGVSFDPLTAYGGGVVTVRAVHGFATHSSVEYDCTGPGRGAINFFQTPPGAWQVVRIRCR